MGAMRHEMTLMITTDSLAFGTFVVDERQRIISWNEAATRTLGYSADITLGRTSLEMLALLRVQDIAICPDTPSASNIHRLPYYRRGDTCVPRERPDVPVRIQVVTRDGETRLLNFNIIHARTLDGATCTVHLFRDVTSLAESAEGDDMAVEMSPHPGNVGRHPLQMTEYRGGERMTKLSPEHLTPREHEVLQLLAQGMATVEIAAALGISRVTARNHVTRVVEKLGVRTRLQAVLTASRLGLL